MSQEGQPHLTLGWDAGHQSDGRHKTPQVEGRGRGAHIYTAACAGAMAAKAAKASWATGWQTASQAVRQRQWSVLLCAKLLLL